MKRYIKGLSAIIAGIVAMAAFAAYADSGSGNGYDPVSPPDPDERYLVRTISAPTVGGYTSVSSDGLFAPGDEACVYAMPNSGFIFKEWRDGSQVVSTDEEYRFTMPSRTVNLTAFFEYDPESPDDPMRDGYTHRVKIYITPGGSGQVGEQYFLMREGDTRDVWATPNPSFKFSGWKVDGKILPPNSDGTPQNPLHITMGKDNLEYTAVFAYAPESPDDPGVNNFDIATGKMVIDYFTGGGMEDAINRLLERGNYQTDVISQVKDLTVIGNFTNNDGSAIERMPILERLDLSRTSLDVFNFYWLACDYDNNRKHNFNTLILPSTVTEVQDDLSDDNVRSMEAVYCYAVTPPRHNGNDGTSSYGIDLYVPAESVELYKNDNYWSRYNITAMDSNNSGINVSFGGNVDLNTYRNMIIVLSDNRLGNEKKYVVNGRTSYSFSNLIESTQAVPYSYNVSLVTKDGYELAKVGGIEVTSANPIRDVVLYPLEITGLEITVVDDSGNDVTDDVNVAWTDSKSVYLSSANPFSGVPLGMNVNASFTLSPSLSSIYKTPGPVNMMGGDKPLTIKLDRYQSYNYSGKIKDDSGNPVAGADVTVFQTLNGVTRSYHALSDGNGDFSMELICEATVNNVKIEAEGFNDIELIPVNDKLPTDIPGMKPLTGDIINVSLLWKGVGSVQPVPYPDPQNVDIDVPGYKFKLQYPVVYLLQDVQPGTAVAVVAKSLKGTFREKEAEAKIVNSVGDVEIVLTELGGIKATVPDPGTDRTVNAMLFNSNGDVVVRTQTGVDGVAFSNLDEGDYTVVLIESNRFVNGISNLSRFTALGLTEGTDYLALKTKVEVGETSSINFGSVPSLDKDKFGDLDPSTTIFTVNKSTATAGAYVTVRSTINFKPELKGKVADVKVRFDIPDNARFVMGSMVRRNPNEDMHLGDPSGGYFIANDFKDGETIKFCIMPNSKGHYYPSATVEYYVDGIKYEQPAGDAYFMAVDHPIYAPAKTCRDYVFARGSALTLSNVEVRANGVLGGSITALADGSWVTKVNLNNVNENPVQSVQGHITSTTANEFTTETRTVEYDEYFPELDMVRMIHNGFAVDFDHTRAKTSAKSYSYNPAYDMYSLTARFSENKDRVMAVNFHILASDGSERTIDGVYNPTSDIWMAALGYTDSYRLPVNVSVDYTYTKLVPDAGGDVPVGTTCFFNMGYIAPDVVPIIDPSGFVYEAVESNRLEGVECTVFYREGYENSFGDIEYRVTRWNAEEYAQENPLFTKEDGSYAWDVPSGDWQVRFRKDGYETAYSEWLPVPPPQLEVNIGMVQNTNPSVSMAKAYSKGVVVAFDKHMDINSLTADNIYVTTSAAGESSGINVNGSIEFVRSNEVGTDLPVDTIRFVPSAEFPVNTGDLILVIRKSVKSYAGIGMAEDYTQTLPLEKEITGIGFDAETIELGDSKTIRVSAVSADAAKGKKLIIVNKSPYVSEISESEIELDANGQAEVSMTGLLEGDALFTLKIDDYETQASVKVVLPNMIVAKPTASLPAGDVYRGTKIALQSNNQAIIYYTTDGTEPSIDHGFIYAAPIEVEDGMTIKAIAFDSKKQSEVASYTYTLKRANMQLRLNSGWNWISHNQESPVAVSKLNVDGVSRILSQTQESVMDPKLGLVGTITSLDPRESYKVMATGNVNIELSDLAYNPMQTWELLSGWNWIGYPIAQPMTPDEAFATTEPETGDIVVGRDGFSTFNGENWVSEIDGFTLTPGNGYLYKSMGSKTLAYNDSKVSSAVFMNGRRLAPAPMFAVDKSKYPSILPVIAEVKKEDGSFAKAGEYMVAAFSNGECRGVGKYVDGYLLMSVYGNPGDVFTFGYTATTADNTELLSGSFTIGEEPLGSIDSPYVIDLGSRSGINRLFNSDEVSVSVVNNMLFVKGESVSQVTLFNVAGLKGVSSSGEKAAVGIPLGGLNAGVHIVSVECGGKWSYHKIIVK